MFEHIFIIHRNIDTQRDITKLLNMNCNHIEVIEPVAHKNDTSQLICMWSKKDIFRKGVISLYETNLLLLERIVKEKLNNVLILEDDALQIDDNIELNKTCLIQYMNIRIWNNRNCSTLANYYPKWENTHNLLVNLLFYRKIKTNRHRAWDLELDYMKKKYNLNFHYSHYFNHPNNRSTLGNSKFQINNWCQINDKNFYGNNLPLQF